MVTGVMSKVGGVGVEVKGVYLDTVGMQASRSSRLSRTFSGGKVADIALVNKAKHKVWGIAGTREAEPAPTALRNQTGESRTSLNPILHRSMNMAGDLYILNLTSAELDILQSAGAVLDRTIQHANRPWATNQGRLTAQLATNVNNRAGLPAHAYITFSKANIGALLAYISKQSTADALRRILEKLSQPLGIVSNKAYLANWPGVPNGASPSLPQTRLYSIIDSTGPVIIEFYQVDGTDLLTKYPVGTVPNWNRVNEH